jgi:hypothetical protein
MPELNPVSRGVFANALRFLAADVVEGEHVAEALGFKTQAVTARARRLAHCARP